MEYHNSIEHLFNFMSMLNVLCAFVRAMFVCLRKIPHTVSMEKLRKQKIEELLKKIFNIGFDTSTIADMEERILIKKILYIR